MEEKFYCVGCKQHYELEVHAAQRQPSKGGSFRHSLISECPKGHRVNKLCKKEVYEKYSVGGLPFAAETDDYTDEQLLKVARMDIDNHIDNGTFYVLGEEPQAFHDGELDGENFYTIVSLYAQHHEDEDEAERILTNMFKKEYPQYLGSETFESPYVGSKALSGISLTTDQLTETIGSGDFDKASLNSSGHQNIFANAEEGNTPVQDPMEFGEMANWTPLDGTPSLKKRKRAEGMTVGVNLEALEPTPDEPETGVSMVPADSLMPEGSGHVIGSQSTSHNFTPFHAEVEAETFIVYPELYEYLMMQDLLRSDKTSTKHLQDDDYEITVPSYLMDDILAAVSEYQSTEKSDSDLVFGQSKTTVAVAAASLAVVGAWLWNKRK
jgi:hypothetical protein